MSHLLIERRNAVAVVVLNRPHAGNALPPEGFVELGACLRELDADDDVRAILLTGAGRIFCAGVDLSGGSTWTDQDGWGDGRPVDPRSLATPVIAAINGAAVGGGMAMAAACDVALVAEDAKLAFNFVRRGVAADNDLHWWLPRQIGLARATELLLTGRFFSGREAVEYGLATRALPATDVLDAALATAQEIAVQCSPLSVAVSKRLLNDLQSEPDAGRAHDIEWAAFRALGGRVDAIEGVQAFLDRREPSWSAKKSARNAVLGLDN